MSEESILRALVYFCAVPAILFPLFYARTDWRQNMVGQSVMQLAASIAITFTLIVTSYAFGNYPGQMAVRIVVYGVLGVSFWRQLYTLIKVQKQAKRSRNVDSA